MARLSRLLATLTRWSLGLCATLLILAALYVSLGRQLAPMLAEYRADVEDRAGAALDMPLRIGRLEGRWSGFAPVLLAHDVTVGEGGNALRLDQVRVVPALWASLKARQVRIAHLEVSGLQVVLSQDAEGQWSLQGIPRRDDTPTDPEHVLEQLQQVAHLSLLDSQVTVQPHDATPMTFTYVNASLSSGTRQQRLDARLNLPDGQPVALDVHTRIDASHWRDAQAQVYLSLPQSDWAAWLPKSLTGDWQFATFKAGGEFWLEWGAGALQSAAVRLNAPHINGRYAERKAAQIDNLALNAWLTHSDQGYQAKVSSLAMSLGEQRWESRLTARQTLADGERPASWHVEADRLDLTPLTPLLDALAPLPDTLREVVNRLNVTGGLRNVMLDWRPDVVGDERLSFAANLDRVGFDAYHGAPAAGNVSGAISGNLGKGELRLDSEDFMLHLDPIFAKPWTYPKANARLTWTLDEERFTLVAPYIKVLGDEGKIAADFLIRIFLKPGHEDYMDLRVGMTDGDGRYTGKYLPAVLTPALDHWLRTAVVAGDVHQGFFQYQGSLHKNAPDTARVISLFFDVGNATLAVEPGWPLLTGVNGKVYVENSGVRIKADKGQMLDTQISDVKVEVPHVPSGQTSHLLVDGKFAGSMVDGLKILQSAPIGTAKAFAGWEGEGPLNGALKLDIALEKGPEPKVVVDFASEGARLKLPDPPLELSQLKGDFRFDSARGLSGKNISGQAFGRPVTAQVFAEGKPGANVTRITASSQIEIKRLTEWLGFNQPIPVSGDIPYQLQLTLDDASTPLAITSDLRGVTIDLPAPFGKSAEQARASELRMTLQGSERRYDAAYADMANLAWAAPASDPLQGRGELFLGQGGAVVPQAKGLRVSGSLPELDIAPWQAVAQRYSGNDPGGNARQLLNRVDLQLGKLTAMGTTLDQARVQLQRSGPAWQLSLDSAQAKGNATLPDAKNAPLDIAMQYVRLPAADPAAQASDNAPDPLGDVDPRNIPALNVKVDQLFQGEQLLGSWGLKTRQTPAGLRFNDMSLGLKGLQLTGEGGWEGAPGASSSWLKGHVTGKNLGDVLKAWGFAPTVTSEKFDLDIDGRWPGSPAWVGLKRYSGTLDANLANGQFVEVEGGAQALRVFGLLNFNSIGRRLRLDFSDLLGKGLSYDKVKGVLVASDGVYVTRKPITLTGPSSNLELDGTLDMVKDRVDAKLLVTLPLTNNLPIAALIVGAPAIGGALFIADKLLGDRVARFASVQYKVEGPWKEPKITFDKPFEKPQ